MSNPPLIWPDTAFRQLGLENCVTARRKLPRLLRYRLRATTLSTETVLWFWIYAALIAAAASGFLAAGLLSEHHGATAFGAMTIALLAVCGIFLRKLREWRYTDIDWSHQVAVHPESRVVAVLTDLTGAIADGEIVVYRYSGSGPEDAQRQPVDRDEATSPTLAAQLLGLRQAGHLAIQLRCSIDLGKVGAKRALEAASEMGHAKQLRLPALQDTPALGQTAQEALNLPASRAVRSRSVSRWSSLNKSKPPKQLRLPVPDSVNAVGPYPKSLKELVERRDPELAAILIDEAIRLMEEAREGAPAPMRSLRTKRSLVIGLVRIGAPFKGNYDERAAKLTEQGVPTSGDQLKDYVRNRSAEKWDAWISLAAESLEASSR